MHDTDFIVAYSGYSVVYDVFGIVLFLYWRSELLREKDPDAGAGRISNNYSFLPIE